jgi:hypothetical protein
MSLFFRYLVYMGLRTRQWKQRTKWITAAEIKYMTGTEIYTWMDCERNVELNELDRTRTG